MLQKLRDVSTRVMIFSFFISRPLPMASMTIPLYCHFSKVNAVARAQLPFQMLTFLKKYL